MKTTLTITLEPNVLAALEEAAQTHARTVEDVVLEAIRVHLRPTMQLDLAALGEATLLDIHLLTDAPELDPVHITDEMAASMAAFVLPEDRVQLTLGSDLWERLVCVAGDATQAVSARRAAVTDVCEILRGTLTNDGVRRWWTRPRSWLTGQTPLSLLEPGWTPDDPAFQRVRALASADAGFAAT